MHDLQLLGEDRGLVGRVAEQLAAAIIEGHFGPGAKLPEEELATRFGISRTPVREALRILASEGFVDIIPRRGATVAEYRPEDIAEIYICRAELLGLSVRLAAASIDQEGLGALEATLEHMREAAGEGDASRYFRLLNDYYDLMSGVAANRALNRLIRSLGRNVLRLRFASLNVAGRLQKSVEASEQALAAVRRGDGATAERIVRRATAEAGQALLAAQYGIDPETAERRYRLTELLA